MKHLTNPTYKHNPTRREQAVFDRLAPARGILNALLVMAIVIVLAVLL